MSITQVLLAALLSSACAMPQDLSATNATLSSRTTLPITFTNTISADHARAGDAVHARTTQVVTLPDGESIPAGTQVVGHIALAAPFSHDKTPYAIQKESVLEIQFDSVHVAGRDVPLRVVVRAMADPIASWGAREQNTADDSQATVTQVGGDLLTPSQSEVVNRNGDVVAYNRKNGVYAHLIARANCDGSTNEVSVGIFSPAACGLYGFTGVRERDAGSRATPSSLSLISTQTSPKIWRHSTALLEMLPDMGEKR